ncbi:S1 RNA-binding domain-containing protein [Lactococcus insecticola]|uniref:S1 motif domain-containing protein n=1 Tax=Pseudolactococcus insecticola TaxID=2709158 RepID=A0A6A0B753_9LACT|nr:S1 RNA-binding domain-containing protein [Lactococcus insecticola]GFH40503.1 hypothetical protein Hs20B_09010 [Lactococcus insecticola]
MIGKVQNITRFGVFVTFKVNEDEKTGLLRWSSLPKHAKSEKFFKDERVEVDIIKRHPDGKVDLALTELDFREKYATILTKTADTLQSLHEKNQRIRDL